MLNKQQAAVVAAEVDDAEVERLAGEGINIVNVCKSTGAAEGAARPALECGGPRAIQAVYTGMPTVAVAMSRQLANSLASAAPIALAIVATVMMVVAWSLWGGLLAMLPIIFPAGVVLGTLGWLGLDVDLGVLLTASLAIAMPLEGTISFIAWFRRGSTAGLFRREAARMAYARVAPGMLDALLAACASVLPLALSGVAGVQLFALLAVPVMLATMVATLSLMPGLACSPLARFFGAIEEPRLREVVRRPVTLTGVLEDQGVAAPGPPHVAGTAVAPAMAVGVHLVWPPISTDERHDMAEGPHAALHAKLQRLRHSAGESKAS
jgi:predicted RND superfamily exporter protein